MKRYPAFLLVSGYAIIGTFPPLVSRLLPPTDVGVMLVIRFAAQLVLLVATLLAARFPLGLPSPFSIASGVAFALYSLLFFRSLQVTDVSRAIILSSLYPIEILIFASITRRQGIRWIDAAGTLLVTLGTFTLSIGSVFRSGDLLAFGSSLAFAAYILCNNRVVFAKEAAIAFTHQAYVSLAAALTCVLLTPVLLSTGSGLVSAIRGSWEPAVIIAVLGALSHSLLTLAQRHLTPLVASVGAVTSPVLAALLAAALFYHSKLALTSVGVCLCAIGLVIVSYGMNISTHDLKSGP